MVYLRLCSPTRSQVANNLGLVRGKTAHELPRDLAWFLEEQSYSPEDHKKITAQTLTFSLFRASRPF